MAQRFGFSSMGILHVSQESPTVLNFITWGGSLAFHGIMIVLSMAFLTQVTPSPASKILQWKVALLEPKPTPRPSEHAQTVRHRPAPTTRSTVSRPQPKRLIHPQRRTQQRQSPRPRAAVVTRPSNQPIKTTVLTRTPVSHSISSPRSLPKPVTQIQNTSVSRNPIKSTSKVRAKTTLTSKKSQIIQTKTIPTPPLLTRHQIISPSPEAQLIQSTRRSEQNHNRIVSGALAQTRNHHQTQKKTQVERPAKRSEQTHNSIVHETIVQTRHQQTQKMDVPHRVSSPDPMNQSIKRTISHPATRHPHHRSEPSTSRSHEPQTTTNVATKHVASIVTPSAIFAGTPHRQLPKKIHAIKNFNSISQETMQSPRKRHSDHNLGSRGLSKEVLAFLKMVREKIQKYRQYPRMAKRLGYQGTTTVSFALSQAGKLTLLKIAEPSGHAMLDEAALEAVQMISPLKPPMTIGGTPIEIPVAFELTR